MPQSTFNCVVVPAAEGAIAAADKAVRAAAVGTWYSIFPRADFVAEPQPPCSSSSTEQSPEQLAKYAFAGWVEGSEGHVEIEHAAVYGAKKILSHARDPQTFQNLCLVRASEHEFCSDLPASASKIWQSSSRVKLSLPMSVCAMFINAQQQARLAHSLPSGRERRREGTWATSPPSLGRVSRDHSSLDDQASPNHLGPWLVCDQVSRDHCRATSMCAASQSMTLQRYGAVMTACCALSAIGHARPRIGNV